MHDSSETGLVAARAGWLSTGQAAEALGYRPEAIRRAHRAGILPGLKLGERGHLRIPASAVRDLAEVSAGRPERGAVGLADRGALASTFDADAPTQEEEL
jgi:hypothetical protein